MSNEIKDAIAKGELPSSKATVLKSLIEDSGNYIFQEGATWDFKRDWPFSYSDEYFASLARLVCAFANANGGIIVFGIHDEHRTAGHNKVAPNLDRFEQALKQLLTDVPALSYRRYDAKTPSAVDVLLICPINSATLPIRFKRGLGKYPAGTIWVRQNHEVLAAEPRHLSLLYCRSGSDSDLDDESLSGGLPPSPATIKRFVGRLSTIDRIFAWLKLSDEPRTFLYGKGGSGKTTVAYEVAKILKLQGSGFSIFGGEVLDNVVFISGKQQMLNVMDQSAEKFVGLDFTDERELYEAILTLANWTSESLTEMTLDELKAEIKALFDLTSNFIVIDDIDTLTTKGIEAGFDFLYSILWRAKRHSKVLYTIRNAPTQSLANSIEVPGLENGDYQEFVRVCAAQFKVQEPEATFVSQKLSAVSERRPLVIESIVALRRTAGNYDRAVNLFEEGSGEDVRGYVFQREWNSLPADNQGRYVLAVLALHGGPVAFADIVALTRYEEGRVRDALADVREMFLQLNEVGTETTFQLGALTRAFVFEQSKKLDLYLALKERVDKYKRSFYPENPILSRLKDRVESLIAKGRRFSDKGLLKEALQTVNDRTLSPRITEDPRFTALQAHVYASQNPSNIDDARRLFGHVIAMKFEPDLEQLKNWFYVERDSGHGLDQCVKIADFICNGKKYSDDEKIEFLSRKGTCLYHRGKNELSFSPQSALHDMHDAIRCHLLCYTKNVESNSSKTDKSEEYARNTALHMFQFLALHGQYDYLFDTLLDLSSDATLKLDPIEEAISRNVELISRERGARSEMQKVKSRLDHVKKEFEKKSQWFDSFARSRVISSFEKTGITLASTPRAR